MGSISNLICGKSLEMKKLEAYIPLTSMGSYCVVFDTIGLGHRSARWMSLWSAATRRRMLLTDDQGHTVIEDMPAGSFPDRPWDKGNNPKIAVWEYLKTHPEFEIDKGIQNKLLITVAPDGYLKRLV